MSISDIVLTETQAGIAQNILDDLAKPDISIVVLDGVSSVGKSTLLEHIRPSIEAAGYTIPDDEYFDIRKADGKVVVPLTLSKRGYMERIGFDSSRKDLHWHTLPAMNEAEITSYLQGKENNSPLMIEEIVRHSLGVPILADSFTGDICLTQKSAINIAAHYFVENIGEHIDFAEDYFQLPITEDLYDALHEAAYELRHIYSLLPKIMGRKDMVTKEFGVVEEPPFFLASDSISIYDKMLSGGDSSPNIVSIYAPEVGEKDLDRIREAFGLSSRPGLLFNVSGNSSRFLMFDVQGSTHKIDVAVRGIDGKIAKSYCDDYDYTSKQQKTFQEREYPIKPSLPDSGEFFFCKHDHRDLSRLTTIRFGWMIESLLQQRGIPYIASNGLVREQYAYIPQQQKIQMI